MCFHIFFKLNLWRCWQITGTQNYHLNALKRCETRRKKCLPRRMGYNVSNHRLCKCLRGFEKHSVCGAKEVYMRWAQRAKKISYQAMDACVVLFLWQSRAEINKGKHQRRGSNYVLAEPGVGKQLAFCSAVIMPLEVTFSRPRR